MLDFLEGLGSASVWAFWVPVLAWTGLAGVGALVLARMRGLHPVAGYRLRQALLLALPVSVLAAPWVPGLFPAVPVPGGPVPSVNGAVMAPSVPDGVALATDGGVGAGIALVLLGAATVAIALLAIGRLAVLATDLRQLHRLRRVAARVDDVAPRRRLRELAEQLGVRRPVELLEGPPDSAPMTFGAWRPVIMIPRSVLGSPDSLDAVLVHELIHIRRADYTWALLDCLVSAAFAFHPLVWVLRRGIERFRETSCDAEVLSRGFARPRPYAELLAHTHVPTQFPMPAVAASLSAPSLKLKERLETMKNFAHRKLTSRQRVGIVLGAGLVCVLVAVAGACATRAEEEPAMFEASLERADREMVVGYVRAREEAVAAQQRAAEAAAHEADVARAY
ncbi:MAG: M56 family metallopeptidase, partial [Gemmatimonadetes bacterium]|nr:M56 family metallopeptidase [Gemmatimonadota bacterium]